MEISTYFFKDRCLFGPYPTAEQALKLENMGVKYFIDLTTPYEKINRYKCNVKYISYPIRDNSIPENAESFVDFLRYIISLIENLNIEEKIYIHCRGGHGRSGMVVACLLCILEDLDSTKSISLTTRYHSLRPTIKEKWISKDCPNMKTQQEFIKKLFG
jgi:hypothetical protein